MLFHRRNGGLSLRYGLFGSSQDGKAAVDSLL